NVDLVLPLQGGEDPFSGRVKIEMADLITEASPRSNREPVGQHSTLITENLNRAGILAFRGRRSITASHQNHGLAGDVHTNLVRVDPDIERRRGLYHGADGSVWQDTMHRQPARVVASGEHMRAVDIRGDEDRA